MKIKTSLKAYPLELLLASLYIFMIPAKPIAPIYLFYGLGILCLILYIFAKKFKIEKFHPFEASYLLFWGFCVVESFFSPSPFAFDLCVRILLYIAGVFSSIRICCLYMSDEKVFSYTSNLFINATLFISCYCILVEGIGDVRLGEVVFEGVYGTYIELSICILIASVLLICKLFNPRDKSKWNYIRFALLLVFCGLSQTRKVFVAIFLMIGIMAFWKSRGKIILRLKYILICCVALIAAISFLSRLEIFNQLLVRFYGMFLFLNGEATYDNSSIIRSNMITVALSQFAKQPVFGAGTDGARIFVNQYLGVDAYSHCNFAELLCNNGIIGFVLYYVFHIKTIIKSVKAYNYDYTIRGILLSSIIVAVTMDYGQVSYYNVEYIFFYAILSLLGRDLLKKRRLLGRRS